MRLNKIDHIWILLLVFIIILSVWIYTKADWLAGSGRDIIVAIVAVSTARKGISAIQSNEKKEDKEVGDGAKKESVA